MEELIVSVDWGTTKLSVSLFDINKCVSLHQLISDNGIGKIYNTVMPHKEMKEGDRRNFLVPIIENQIRGLEKAIKKDVSTLPIYISGMASSNLGLVELPYCNIPVSIFQPKLVTSKIKLFSNASCTIISGMASKVDVMRGEETQVLGAMAMDEQHDFLILPGTHSKHVTIKKQRIKNIKTYMTGELFSVLSNATILEKSINKTTEIHFTDSFLKGVEVSQKGNLLNNLFSVRTNQLLKKEINKESNYAYLSGLLIGEELKDLKREKIANLALISGIGNKELYLKALKFLFSDLTVTWYESEFATAMGHRAFVK